jgi:predicted nucleic acid-binding protein
MMDRVLDILPADKPICLMIGIGEVASVLVRRYHAGDISPELFRRAMDELTRDSVHAPAPTRLPVANNTVEAALPFLEPHSINATDAVLLRIGLELRAGMRLIGDELVLIASDARLLKAAKADGLPTFDPATQPPADLVLLLGRHG